MGNRSYEKCNYKKWNDEKLIYENWNYDKCNWAPQQWSLELYDGCSINSQKTLYKFSELFENMTQLSLHNLHLIQISPKR